ncbi:AbgT family transporter, partial [Vibrio cholerae]|uniref:AbgT family transporter n=1 Tax=Vibrio cholerae TaxID=666 RepID=UPI0020CF09A7
SYQVNPLANIYFTGLSSIIIVAIGWYVTDKVIEPRLAATKGLTCASRKHPQAMTFAL